MEARKTIVNSNLHFIPGSPNTESNTGRFQCWVQYLGILFHPQLNYKPVLEPVLSPAMEKITSMFYGWTINHI
jgi:hypothetical protein